MEGLPNNIQTIWEAHHRCVDVKEKLQETSWVAVLHVSSFKLEFSPINQPLRFAKKVQTGKVD